MLGLNREPRVGDIGRSTPRIYEGRNWEGKWERNIRKVLEGAVPFPVLMEYGLLGSYTLVFSTKMIRKCATPQRKVSGPTLAKVEGWY